MLLQKKFDQRFSLEKTVPGINLYLFSKDEQSVNFKSAPKHTSKNY